MRKLILGVCFISIFVLGIREVACQCMCAPVPGSRLLTAHEAFKTAEVVFTGEVVESKKGTLPDEYEVRFKLKRVWKKDVGESVVLRTFRHSCGFFGEEGEEFLVYAYTYQDMLTTNGCTRTKYLSEAVADLKEFEEKGEKPIRDYETESSQP